MGLRTVSEANAASQIRAVLAELHRLLRIVRNDEESSLAQAWQYPLTSTFAELAELIENRIYQWERLLDQE